MTRSHIEHLFNPPPTLPRLTRFPYLPCTLTGTTITGLLHNSLGERLFTFGASLDRLLTGASSENDRQGLMHHLGDNCLPATVERDVRYENQMEGPGGRPRWVGA